MSPFQGEEASSILVSRSKGNFSHVDTMVSEEQKPQLSNQVVSSAAFDTNWDRFQKDAVSASGLYCLTKGETEVSNFPLPVVSWKDQDNNSAEILGVAIGLERLLQYYLGTALPERVYCFVDSEAADLAFRGLSKSQKRWPKEVARLLCVKNAFEVRGVKITCRRVSRKDAKVAEQDSRAR